MKKIVFITVCLLIGLFVSTTFAVEVIVFGPNQYLRTTDAPNVFFNTFSAIPKEGKLIINNGDEDGNFRISSAKVFLNGKQLFETKDFNQHIYYLEAPINLFKNNSISVELRSKPGNYFTIEVIQDVEPPTVNLNADPATIQIGESSTLTWSSTDADFCVIEPGIGSVDPNGSISIAPTETTNYTITATGLGGTATANVAFTVTYPPPTVSFTASPATIVQGGSSTLSWTSIDAQSAHIDNGIGIVSVDGSTTVFPDHTTTYTITMTGPTGSTSARNTVMVMGISAPQPEGSFGEQYEDLVPLDATIESYDPKRFSLITGLVHAIDDTPISDISVTIHSHPEYGTVSTDIEGRFSIPSEGGTTMTIVYEKEGLTQTQRTVYVPWNDIAVVETIQMISEDPVSTVVTFDGNPGTVVTHQSTKATDKFGSRSCSMVFTGDNRAYSMDAQGNVIQELNTIAARATEFTTPESMPAKLPPNSAYTYCVELSVDGVQRVSFKNPVITWVDNFLGFDVGEIVPVGYYDRDRGVWVPSDNGIVVKLLDTDIDGIVDALDADGDNLPDDLNNNSSFIDEVTGLDDAHRYPPGSTFWRVAVTHFTPWDCNWPFGPPLGAITPNPTGEPNVNQPIPKEPIPAPQDIKCLSSYVKQRNRVFHEDISIPGTDMTLHYASNRVEGYVQRIVVPASGETVPDNLKKIIVRVEVAGRILEQILDPLPNQMAEFVLDLLDYQGKTITDPLTARVSVGFEYDLIYYSASRDFVQAFGQAGNDLTAIRARQEVIFWKRSVFHLEGRISTFAEGWTLSSHHHLSPMDPSTLHKGDGTLNKNNVNIITTVAGNGTYGYSGDGGPATEAQLRYPAGAALDASGNFYTADWPDHRIRKVDTSGIITTVAGNGIPGYSGDGGPATEAQLYNPHDVTVDASGNLYFPEMSNQCIRKVDTSGIITTVAGNGTYGYSGDGGPATEAQLRNPRSVAVDASGNLYIADRHSYRIRKVDTSGIITTVAGSGIPGYNGDGGPATEARINEPFCVLVDSSGNLYIADRYNHCIRKVDTSGIITTVAGSGIRGYSGDGGPATEAQLNHPCYIDVDASSNLYIQDHVNFCIRRVDTSGIITTVAGSGIRGYSGDDGPAIEARFLYADGIAVDVSGNIYTVDCQNRRIRKIGMPSSLYDIITEGNIVFAEESGLGHILSSTGYHLRTINLDTGIALREFEYDQDNNLISITDQFGNQTTIQNDATGVPTSITSPDGLTTILTIDYNNHLTHITLHDGNYYSFEYTPDGLMTAKIELEDNRFENQFNSIGRLTDVSDEEGGHWNYNRTTNVNGVILTEVLSGEGNLISYLDHTDSTGAYTSTIIDPTGAETLFDKSANGLTVNKLLPCGTELDFQYNVDSEYKFKFVKEITETTPLGLEKVTLRDKTYEDTNSDDVTDLITEAVIINNKVTILDNNTLQSLKTITSPEGRMVVTLYDPDTLLTTSLTIPGLYEIIYGYDARGRLIYIDTNTRRADFTYNAQGFLESIADPENQTTTYTYDTVGRRTEINRPDGSSVGFTYDQNGNMTMLTTPSTIDHEFGFNLVNLKDAYHTPISGSYSYMYDRDRQLIQMNFPSGNQINNIYDNTKLVQIQTPEGNIDFTYLCATKVESITNGTDTISYGYDGKLISSEILTGTLNQTLGYSYNNDFNLIGFSYAGDTLNYTYDNDGLLTGADSFTIFRNSGNGLPEAVSDGTLSLSRTFNGYGELSYEGYTINGQYLASWNLSRDNIGRITVKTERVDGATSNYSYTYDPMGRLLSVTKDDILVEEYEYGPNGTRTHEMNTQRDISGRSFTYSDENHLLTTGDTTYEYNVDGFLFTKTQSTGVTIYDYSSRGELLSVALSGSMVIEYVHDPLGRRIAKKIDGTIVEKYLWQGQTRLLAVYDGSDNLIMRFEYAEGRMPLAMTKDGYTYYLTYDQVGSLRVVADALGNVVKKVEYDSFGNIITDTDPSFDVPFGFAGGLHDKDTGLVRFGYRDYDPDIGRWTAKDPILFAGGDTDLYGYCLNDPINLIDPFGLVDWGAVAKGGLAVVGGGVTVVGGALFSTTGIGAVGGVPAVLGGTASFSWGVSQIIAGFMDNEIPFMGTKEAIIKGTTKEGLLQDELLGLNTLTDILSTGRLQPSKIGNINSIIQNTGSIVSSGGKILDSTESNCE